MALDTSIPLAMLGKVPSSFDVARQLQQQDLQRDMDRSLVQERQLGVQKQQQAQQDAAAYRDALIKTSGMTPEQAAPIIRSNAPDSYPAWQKFMDESTAKAAETRKANADAQNAAAQARTHQQEWEGNLYDAIDQADYNPLVINALVSHAVKENPDFAPKAQTILQVAATQGKDGLKAFLQPQIPASIGKTRADTANAAAELPGKQAQSAQLQKVNAGTSPLGITADQQATILNAQQNARTAAGQLSVSQAREKREAAKDANDPFTGTAAGGPQASGDAVIANLPQGIQAQVKALTEGRMQFPGGAAMRSPYWQQMLQLVSAYDPSFDAVNFNARSATRKAFTSGKEAGMVNTLNTAIGHLADLKDASDALNQGAMGDGNFTSLNYVKNALRTAGGSDKVTNFRTIVHRVAPELVSAYRGSGGAEADIKTNMSDFSENASPDQRNGALMETAKLLESKIQQLENQYQSGMGTDKVSIVTPGARQVLDALKGGGSASQPAATAAPATSAGPKMGERRVINGKLGEWDGKGWKAVSQ